MTFVLGSFIYTSISSAKRTAADARLKHFDEALESRKRMGIDVWDQKAERERLRGEMEKEKAGRELAREA